jgi:hypothetical protein
VKLESRAITNSERMRDSAVMISSTMPSAKYSCSASALRQVNGKTATDGLSRRGDSVWSQQAYPRAAPRSPPAPCQRIGLLRLAGLRNVHTAERVQSRKSSDPRPPNGLSENEFNTHWKAIADHLVDPATLLVDQLFVQAWGERWPQNYV